MDALHTTPAKPARAQEPQRPPPKAAPPSAPPAQAHRLAHNAGLKPNEALGTTRKDVLLDPTKAKGSGLAVTTSEAGAPSTDGVSATILYFQALEENPGASEAELWTAATRRDYNYGGAVTTFQQPRAQPRGAHSTGERGARGMVPPTPARESTRVAPAPGPRPQQRHALVIGNNNYKTNFGVLPGAGRDAELMAARYEARGYAVTHLTDLPARAVEQAIAAEGAMAQAGDALAIYYAGHGLNGDLTGVDTAIAGGKASPLVPAAVPSAAMGKALSRGAELELVIDACESGPMQQRLAADHAGLAQGQVEERRGISRAELMRQSIDVRAETTGLAPIKAPEAGAAYAKAFEPSEHAARLHADNAAMEAERPAARAAAARERAGAAPAPAAGAKASGAKAGAGSASAAAASAAKASAAKAGGKPSGLSGATAGPKSGG